MDQGKLSAYDLDDRMYDAMNELSDSDAVTVMDRFGEKDLRYINNKKGFIMAIIRRVTTEGDNDNDLISSMNDLPREVKAILEDQIERKKLRKGDLENRVAHVLRDIPTDAACEALNKYFMTDPETIRSKMAFMMGILKRIQSDVAQGRYGGGGGGGRGGSFGGYGGGGYGMPPPGAYGMMPGGIGMGVYGAPNAYGGGGGGGGRDVRDRRRSRSRSRDRRRSRSRSRDRRDRRRERDRSRSRSRDRRRSRSRDRR